MADDKMKNDDLNPAGGKQAGKQAGQQGGQGGNQPGQQAPGRHQPDDGQSSQRGGGQDTTGNRGIEDDELDKGDRGSNIGGQEGGRQNR